MTPLDDGLFEQAVEAPEFRRGDRVVKTGGRYGGPGRIVGETMDLGGGYRLYSVAMRVEGGYGEFVHVFPANVLTHAPADAVSGDAK